MQDYQAAIRAFARDEMTQSGLCDALSEILKQEPGKATRILEEIENRIESQQQRHQLVACIREHTVEQTVLLPGAGDRTQVLPLAETQVDSRAATTADSSPQAYPSEAETLLSTAGAGAAATPEPDPMPVLEPGSILKDRFVLEQKIGAGGMGMVFRARDLRREEALDKEPYVAIKLLNNKYQDKPYAFIALQREAKKAQKLSHPNIITVYDFDRDGSLMMMTMELLEGQSLLQLIRSQQKKPLALPQAFSIIRDICRALSHAHRNRIVHADIKPANVFITSNNQVKILDFGIARAVQEIMVEGAEETAFSPDMYAALTPTYASREMLLGEKARASDDIYALACISYELLTGHHPFGRKTAKVAEAEGLQAVRPPGLKNRQWRGLQKGLAFRREQRTAEVTDFMREVLPERRTLTRPAKVALIGFTIVLPVILGAYLHQLEQPGDLESVVAFEDLLPADRQKVSGLLEIAEAHMSMQRLTAPPGSNAYAAYREVLKVHPDNSTARDGLKRIADRYLRMARERFDSGDRAGAWQMLEAGLAVRPAHEGLLAMQKRLAK